MCMAYPACHDALRLPLLPQEARALTGRVPGRLGPARKSRSRGRKYGPL